LINEFLDKSENNQLAYDGTFGKYRYFYSETLYWDLTEYSEIKD
jgi:hypothetical protein